MVAQPSFTETAPIGENTGFDYTLGWGTYYYKGHKVIEKGGALSGDRTVVVLVPEEKLGVAGARYLNIRCCRSCTSLCLKAYLDASGHDLAKRDQSAKHADFYISFLCPAFPRVKNPGATDTAVEAYTGFLKMTSTAASASCKTTRGS
jgi:hypothetical protein